MSSVLILRLNSFIVKNRRLLEFAAALAILVTAILPRLMLVFFMKHPPLVTDAYNYDVMTKQFLDKGFWGYNDTVPNALITPGYPLFLSIIYAMSGYGQGSPLTAVRVVQALIGALTCLIVYLIARKLINRKCGIIAGFIYALYPPFIWSPTLILTETLYNFLFLLYIYLQILVLSSRSKAVSFSCGLTFAAAVMVRPLVFPLFFLPFLAHFILKRDWSIIKMFGFSLLGVLVIMVPWWIRNIITMDKFILLATQTGFPFIAGMFPYHRNVDVSHYQAKNQMAEGLKILMEGLRTDPVLYIKWFTIGKLQSIFGYMWLEINQFYFLLYLKPLHYLIVVFGWIGTFYSIFKKEIIVIPVFVVLLTCMQLMFTAWPRYAYPIIPLLIISMLYFLNSMFKNIRSKIKGNSRASSAQTRS